MICHSLKDRNFTPRLGQGELPDLSPYASIEGKDFERAGELWNAQLPAYEDMLFARLIGERDSHFEPIDRGNWSWLQTSRRYRNRETKEAVSTRKYLQLRDDFTDSLYPNVERIGTSLVERDITVHEWLRQMAKLIQHSHLAAWLLGGGGYNTVSASDIVTLEATLRQQYDYLRNFGEDIIEANRPDLRQEKRIFTERGLFNRAVMYIESITASAERARATTYGFHPDILPHYPGDGSMICLTRCRCHWRFDFRSTGTDSFYHAYWTLRGGRPDGKNCSTCLVYARIYNPYTVVRF